MDTAVACLSCERRVCRPALAKAELVILLVIERDLVSSVMHVRVEKSRVRNMEDVVEELEPMKHRTFRFYCKHSTGIVLKL